MIEAVLRNFGMSKHHNVNEFRSGQIAMVAEHAQQQALARQEGTFVKQLQKKHF